jgi:hypothetical protein
MDLLPQNPTSREDMFLYRMIIDHAASVINTHQRELKPIFADKMMLTKGERPSVIKEQKRNAVKIFEGSFPFHERLN